MTHTSRLLLATGLALGGGVVALAPTAQAAVCSTTSGVTVVVSSPVGTSTGCAAGDPSSGLSALSGAGFGVVQMIQQPGFVCRINGYPSSSVDPCQRAGAQSKWAYYHARRGGSWTYSSEGAASYNPAPGSVEGWGWGGPPSVAPPAAPTTPKPTPKPTPPRSTPKPSQPSSSTPPSSRPGTATRSSGTTSAGRTSASGPRTTAPNTAVPATTSSASGPGSTGSTAESTTTTEPALAGGPVGPTDNRANGSSPWPFVGGGGLVAALAAAAAYGARRRRLPQH